MAIKPISSALCAIAVGLAALGVSTPATAQEKLEAGVYIGVFGGVNLHTSSDITSRVSGLDAISKHKAGYLAGGVLGYFYDPYRFEVEYSYRRNSLKSLDFTQDNGLGTALTGAPFGSKLSASGRTAAKSWMANAYYDFETESKFRPYVGFGVGVVKINRINQSIGGAQVFGGEERGFAGQFLAGFRTPLNDYISFDLGYRFYFTEHLEFGTALGNSARAPYDAHSLTIGLSVQFGGPKYDPTWRPTARVIPPPPGAFEAPPAPAPPPPPPPPPPPSVPGPFMVFFDFDQSNITGAAQAVIEEAADAYRVNGIAEISLIGHTDRAGSDQYNLELSMRRANAVRKALVALGISDAAILVSGQGEFQPLVPTEDGIREPQNRRTSITLGGMGN